MYARTLKNFYFIHASYKLARAATQAFVKISIGCLAMTEFGWKKY